MTSLVLLCSDEGDGDRAGGCRRGGADGAAHQALFSHRRLRRCVLAARLEPKPLARRVFRRTRSHVAVLRASAGRYYSGVVEGPPKKKLDGSKLVSIYYEGAWRQGREENCARSSRAGAAPRQHPPMRGARLRRPSADACSLCRGQFARGPGCGGAFKARPAVFARRLTRRPAPPVAGRLHPVGRRDVVAGGEAQVWRGRRVAAVATPRSLAETVQEGAQVARRGPHVAGQVADAQKGARLGPRHAVSALQTRVVCVIPP